MRYSTFNVRICCARTPSEVCVIELSGGSNHHQNLLTPAMRTPIVLTNCIISGTAGLAVCNASVNHSHKAAGLH